MKPPKSMTDVKTWSSLTFSVSILSLALSLIALWYNALAPADMRASLSSDLVFHWEGGEGQKSPGPGWVPAGLMVVANCSFANNGAKVGEIKGVSLQLQDDDGTTWVFEPWFIVDEEKLTDAWGQSFDQRKSISWPTLAPARFHSIVLPGKQTAAYSYLFRYVPSFSKNIVLGPPHRFHVTLFTVSPGETQLRVQDQETLVLTPEWASLIGQSPSLSIPFEGVGDMVKKSLQK